MLLRRLRALCACPRCCALSLAGGVLAGALGAASCAGAPLARAPAGAPQQSAGSARGEILRAGPTRQTPASWRTLAERLVGADPVERFLEASRLLLGTPYENGPLGEGEAGGPDPDPRFDFARADCVTYLEQSLALALADPSKPDGFLSMLDRIRYAEGEVGFATRNHYMVRDWIPANRWLLEDVTAACAAGQTLTVHRTIDRAGFLREHGVEPAPVADAAREISCEIIPRQAAARAAGNLRPGDLVFWVGKKPGILVAHTGLVDRDGQGQWVFRHGSSRAGRVLEEPFLDYARAAEFAEGFLVLRLRGEQDGTPANPPPKRASR